MFAKISIGSSLYGALSYNGEKMNKEQGRVLGANKIILPADGQIDIARMVENFNAFMPKSGKTKKPVLHISHNPHPDDRLTEQQYEILAREYLEKLGFGEQPFIIYKHEDIDRHHIHIVTVNVNEQGKRLNQDLLFRRSARKSLPICRLKRLTLRATSSGRLPTPSKWSVCDISFRLWARYNIRCEQTDGRVNGREYHGLVYFATDDEGKVIANPFKASRLSKFASRTAVEGRFERAKNKIDVAPTRDRVADVLERATDKEDFTAKLKDCGLDVVFRYTDEGRIYGVTFIDHNTMTVLNGSRLGKQFSANALNERFNNPQAQPTNDMPLPDTTVIVPEPEQTTDTHSDTQSQSGNTQAPSDGQHQSATTHSATDHGDSDFTLLGLDLFQLGQSFNPDEEEFRRRMQRKSSRKRFRR